MAYDIKSDTESLYIGFFTAYKFEMVKDAETGIVFPARNEYLKDIPCRISYQLIRENKQSAGPDYKSQTVKLFTSPDVKVYEGSYIKILQNGREEEYIVSGVPAVYSGHQEILLNIKNVG